MTESLSIASSAWDSVVESARSNVEAADAATKDAVAFRTLLRQKEQLQAALNELQQSTVLLGIVQRSINAALAGFAHPVRMDRRAFDGSRVLASRAGSTASWRWGAEPVLRRLLSDLSQPGNLFAIAAKLSLVVSSLLRSGIAATSASREPSTEVLWQLYESACGQLARHATETSEHLSLIRAEVAALDREVAGCLERLESLSSDLHACR